MIEEENLWIERRENHATQPEDARNAADTDYSRLIHSASFRRLQGKTQILNLGDSDFYRTRLTHSLEVSQIAMGIVRQLEKHTDNEGVKAILPDYTQIQAIGLSHDLGHPPFGHGGEVALNYCMREHGGFEGNGQTLRILSRLEKFSANAGANLTRRTMLGVLKYPARYSDLFNCELIPSLVQGTSSISIIDRNVSKPPKCYMDSENDVVDWILKTISNKEKMTFCSYNKKELKHAKTIHKSFDCSIMDSADDIAYGVHDLEDAIALNLINKKDFLEYVTDEICSPFLNKLNEKYPSEFSNNVFDGFVEKLFGENNIRKRQISRLVHHFITHVEIYEDIQFDEPLLKYRVRVKPEIAVFLKDLKDLVSYKVIKSPNVQQLEFKGQKMVVSVFEAIASEPFSFLPLDMQKRYENQEDIRVICDYVAGMTDAFLLKTYERLFSPRMGSVFDKL